MKAQIPNITGKKAECVGKRLRLSGPWARIDQLNIEGDRSRPCVGRFRAKDKSVGGEYGEGDRQKVPRTNRGRAMRKKQKNTLQIHQMSIGDFERLFPDVPVDPA